MPDLYTGWIVEESLTDNRILNTLTIAKVRLGSNEDHTDRSTWAPAVAHGLELGTPAEQVDFAVERRELSSNHRLAAEDTHKEIS